MRVTYHEQLPDGQVTGSPLCETFVGGGANLGNAN